MTSTTAPTTDPTTEPPGPAHGGAGRAAGPLRRAARALRRSVLGLRARVLVWYVALFAVSLLVAVLTIRQVLLVRLDDEVDRSLAKEVAELQLLAGGVDPRTGQPFGEDVAGLFDTYFARNVPAEREFFVALVEGRLHATRPAPRAARGGAASLLPEWRALDAPTWGESDSSAGPVRWLAVPVRAGSASGTFVVADLVGEERAEITGAVRVIAWVAGSVMLLATLLAFATTGRVLAPIRGLTRTARRISESDLSERIAVSGEDEVAELARTFNEMLDRLETAFAAQRTFLDDVGHELRTPITIVRGNLELLPDDPTERAEAVALCLDELDRMARYVQDLMTLAKAEQPDFLLPRNLDVAELTDSLHARGVAIDPNRRWVLERLAPVTISADPERVTQAMVNLLANAARHAGPNATIRIGSSAAGGEVRLWVADDGVGIAADAQERIFERFGRARDTSGRDDGAGLGLAIVAAIAAAHGGRVELDSAPGAGATFTLVLPAGGTGEDDDGTEGDDRP